MAICRCSCGAKFKVPDESLGKKAKCKKCGSVFKLTEEDEGLIPIADDPWPDMGEIAQAASSAASAAATSAPKPPPGYKGVIIETADSSDSSDDRENKAQGSRGFLSSVVWTLLFPTTPVNLLVFVGIFLILVFGQVASFAPLIGGFCSFVILGWYAAFRFNILQSAAAGESNLPGIELPTDWMDDVIGPFFAWLGSWLVVLLPVFSYIMIAWQRGTISGVEALEMTFGGFAAIWGGPQGASDVYYLLLCLALALWPMVILCVALGGFASLVRIDLIFVTLARTLPAYIVTMVLVGGTMALGVLLAEYVAGKAAPAPGTRATGIMSSVMVLRISLLAIAVYADIVMVRLIGLYYHHFKSKFAWSWG